MQFKRPRWAGSAYRPSFFGGAPFLPPVIKALLLANVAIWILFDVLLAQVEAVAVLTEYLALWPLGEMFMPWQVLTYMFLHGGFLHLLLNMLVLWMFGTELELTWGSRKFLGFYVLCGLGAALANLLVAPLLGQVGPTVGASGAIFGILIAFAVLFPDRPVYLYFLLPVKAKYFIAGYIALELFYGVTGTTDGIAHVAHLGGAAAGFLLMYVDRHNHPFGSLFRRRSPSVGWRGVREAGRTVQPRVEIRDASYRDLPPDDLPDDESGVTQEAVDAILDKINRHGYQSLTEQEKRLLLDASRKFN